MIAISGATGQLGKKVIDSLLKHLPADQIVALARHPEIAEVLHQSGVNVRQASYDYPETLGPALQGINQLLLISSSEIGKRETQHNAIISAAEQAGVQFIAYTSLLHADTSPLGLATEHRVTEQRLRTGTVPYALLRNGWYSENYAAVIPAALEKRHLYGAAGEGRIASASRQDYADAAVAVLLAPPVSGTIYELAGDSAYTLTEFAAEIAAQQSQPVSYVNLSQEDYAAGLQRAGLPEPLAHMLADSDAGASQGGLYDNSQTLSTLIGRPTMPWQETIRQTLSER